MNDDMKCVLIICDIVFLIVILYMNLWLNLKLKEIYLIFRVFGMFKFWRCNFGGGGIYVGVW